MQRVTRPEENESSQLQFAIILINLWLVFAACMAMTFSAREVLPKVYGKSFSKVYLLNHVCLPSVDMKQGALAKCRHRTKCISKV